MKKELDDKVFDNNHLFDLSLNHQFYADFRQVESEEVKRILRI